MKQHPEYVVQEDNMVCKLKKPFMDLSKALKPSLESALQKSLTLVFKTFSMITSFSFNVPLELLFSLSMWMIFS